MRRWLLVAGTTVLSALFLGALRFSGLGPTGSTAISDLGQLAAAAVATAGCALAARRTRGTRRRAWALLAAGCGAWTAGQALWTHAEVVAHHPVPFPSLADLGFVLFPLLCTAGLVTWLGTQSHQLVARGRDVVDGAIIAASLLVLSWVTTLGSVVSATGDGVLSLTLSLAYPVGDLVLATLVLMALVRVRGQERGTLSLLGVGLGALAVADSAYVYLVGVGDYTSADLISAGWVTGFLFVAAASAWVRPTRLDATETTDAAGGTTDRSRAARPSALQLVLAYVPLGVASAVLCARALRSPGGRDVELLLGVAMVTLVLVRQFLAVRDNHQLVVALGDARDQLEHQALHDPLTGLSNRRLFADRLDHALARRASEVSVLFCDLDDFKLVNDRLGHDAGDELLRLVASRLSSCVRPGDTVARLGGDEFAILLDAAGDAMPTADRVLAAVQQPASVGGRTVPVSISVGVAHHPPIPQSGGRDVVTAAAALLRSADTAMYAAKGAGKGRAVLSDRQPATVTSS